MIEVAKKKMIAAEATVTLCKKYTCVPNMCSDFRGEYKFVARDSPLSLCQSVEYKCQSNKTYTVCMYN